MKWLVVEDKNIGVSKGVATILLLTSAVTGVTGMGLMAMYEAFMSYYHVAVFYPALYIGVLNISACILCFAAGVASLKRRLRPLTAASAVLLLSSGSAAFIALGWLYGLLFGVLQIGVSIAVLASMVALKAKK